MLKKSARKLGKDQPKSPVTRTKPPKIPTKPKPPETAECPGKHLVIAIGEISLELRSLFSDEDQEKYHLALIDHEASLQEMSKWTRIRIASKGIRYSNRNSVAWLRAYSENTWGHLRPQLETLIRSAESISVVANLGGIVGTAGAIAVAGLVFHAGRPFQTYLTVPDQMEKEGQGAEIIQWALGCISVAGNEIQKFLVPPHSENPDASASDHPSPGRDLQTIVDMIRGKRAATSLPKVNEIAPEPKPPEKPIERQLPKPAGPQTGEALHPQNPKTGGGKTSAPPQGIARPRSVGGLVDIRASVNSELQRLSHLLPLRNHLTRIARQYDAFDQHIHGLQESDLLIIGSRPLLGKSTFLMNLALHRALTMNQKVLFFSLEESDKQWTQRVLATIARLDPHRLRCGMIDDAELERLCHASEALSGSPLQIDSNPENSVPAIREAVTQWAVRQEDAHRGLILIDSLQLLRTPKSSDSADAEGRSQIARDLKQLAVEMKVPIVCSSHLSRFVENRPDRRPQLPDLPDKTIEPAADLICFLCVGKTDTPPSADSAMKRELIVAKNCHGPVGTMDWSF